MNLAQALRVQRGDVVAFTGAGGKTTAMFRLAAELTAAGLRVITTTTTRLFATQIALAPHHVVINESGFPSKNLETALEKHRHVLVTGHVNEAENKVFGVSLLAVEKFHALKNADVVLVEADGARMRPFKAPASHEPAVPDCTTILVPVVGLDVIGRALNETQVHRPEQISALTGLQLGNAVDIDTIAKVLAHQNGGAKGLPPHARCVPLLNKIDALEPDKISTTRQLLTRALLKHALVDEVIVAAASKTEVEICAVGRTAGIILAAGRSKRFGRPKQLARWKNDTLLNHVLKQALASVEINHVIVVLGCEAGAIAASLPQLENLTVVVNDAWAEGQSTSVRAGVKAVQQRGEPFSSALFLMGDQPEVGAEIIDALIENHQRTHASVVVATYNGERNSPTLFDKTTFDALQNLKGDVGGRALFQRFADSITTVNFSQPSPRDVDTPEDISPN